MKVKLSFDVLMSFFTQAVPEGMTANAEKIETMSIRNNEGTTVGGTTTFGGNGTTIGEIMFAGRTG